MDWTKFWSNLIRASQIAATGLAYLWQPIGWLLYLILQALIIITTPFRWLGNAIYQVIALPLRFLARFETLFYYLATACLIGLIAGAGLYYFTRLIYNTFHLYDDSSFTDPSVPKSPGRTTQGGRTAASYRAERAQKQEEHAWNHLRLNDLPLLPSDQEIQTDASYGSKGWSSGGGLARFPLGTQQNGGEIRRKGLLSTTIFEEDDDSEEFGFD